MDLSPLTDFHAVTVYGGVSVAARATGTPKATLSRRIRGLETGLGVRLFERGARSARLTEERRERVIGAPPTPRPRTRDARAGPVDGCG